MYLYRSMSNIAEKGKILFEWSKLEIGMKHFFHMDWSEIKYDINSKISFKKYLYLWKKPWMIRIALQNE
jgi:hypothetical protein